MNDELIASWHAGEVEVYILSALEADWNPAQQQMRFYCESDPVDTFREEKKSTFFVLVLTSELSPGILPVRLTFEMYFNAIKHNYTALPHVKHPACPEGITQIF